MKLPVLPFLLAIPAAAAPRKLQLRQEPPQAVPEVGATAETKQGSDCVSDPINSAVFNSRNLMTLAMRDAIGLSFDFNTIPISTSGAFQITESSICSGNPITVTYTMNELIFDGGVRTLSLVEGTGKLDCDRFAGDFQYVVSNGNRGTLRGQADYSANGCTTATSQQFNHYFPNIDASGVVYMEGKITNDYVEITSSTVYSMSISTNYLISWSDDITSGTDFAPLARLTSSGTASGTLQNTLFESGVSGFLSETLKSGIQTGFPNTKLPERDCWGDVIKNRIKSFFFGF